MNFMVENMDFCLMNTRKTSFMLVLVLGVLIVLLTVGVVYAGAFDSRTRVSNSSMVTGLYVGGGNFSASEVYDDFCMWNSISGKGFGDFSRFQWNRTQWVSNSSLVDKQEMVL